MDLEASITERLEKLRQWQIEQQEKLSEQQRIQREILSHEQDRIYKVLRLSLDPDLNHIVEDAENKCANREIRTNTIEQAICDNATLQYNVKNSNNMLKSNEEEIIETSDDELHEYHNEKKNKNSISVVIDTNTNFQKNCNFNVLSQNITLSSDMLIEGVKPLPLDNVTSNKSTVSIDDIPIPSSKKNFQTLLEERLDRESKIASKVDINSKNEKRPFLKKGQGLSRFKGSSLKPVIKKTSIASFSHNTQCIDKIDTCSKFITHENVENVNSNASIINTPIAVETAQKLNLKAASLPRKIIYNKSGSITPTKSTAAINAISDRLKSLSDFDSKTEKELEEVRIFELLEEKAENSSFCSTSSTVIAFLQQSTPFKMKKSLNCIGNDTMVNKKQHKRTSDALEQRCIVEQFTNSEDSRQTVQYPFNQFDTNNVSYNNVADINCDIALANDTIVEDIRECSTVSNKISQNKEACMDYLEDDKIHNVISSVTDIVEEDTHGNHSGLICDSGVDVNHRVRFSEYNEYRIIDLTNMVNASAKKSALINYHSEQEDWNDCSTSESRSYSIDRLSLDCDEAQICCSPQAISNQKVLNASIQLPLPQHNIIKNHHIIGSNAIMSNKENKNGYGQSLFNNENNNKCNMFPKVEKIPQIDKNYSQRFVLLNQPSLINTQQACSKVYEKEQAEEEHDEAGEEDDEEAEEDDEEAEEDEEEEVEVKEEEKEGEEEEEEYTQRNSTKKIIGIDQNAEKYQRDMSSEDKENWKISNFESNILKTRLLELEKEIDIFRKESSALLFQRQKLQEDRTLLHKKYMEKDRSLEENKMRIQNQLQEEKKRLMREKIAMENRIRDAQEKARLNKLEKQKTQDLHEQLEKLRVELNIKESRWSAAESRYKSELRVSRVEITKLKQEIENSHNLKKTINMKNMKRMNGQINTKTINQIKTSPNKRIIVSLSKRTSTKALRNLPDTCVDDEYDNEDHDDIHDSNNDEENDGKDKLIKPVMNAIDMDDDLKEMEDNLATNESEQIEIKLNPKHDQGYTEENITTKKRDLYENLLKDATSDLMQDQQCSSAIMQSINSRYSNAIITQMRDSKIKSNTTSAQNNDNSHSTNENLENITEVFTTDSPKYYTDRLRKTSDDDRNENVPMLITFQDKEFSHEKTNLVPHTSYQNDKESTTNVVKQIQHSDGRIEYLYSNGNVKKVFPDQGLTKMIYYNGDVRETDKNGKVKYFYATTRTWHTTTLDGIEILEFPDGQVEKHSSDGTIEVSFPDGVLRIAQADGTEKWVLPDGTVAQTFVNGDKILTLPNGQKEIHTKEHKRREYPDGTVKLVYVDGTQETRYSSGRKRLKDKDGNLIMDFYEN